MAGEIAVATIRGNKQGVIVFSRVQSVTAGMVSCNGVFLHVLTTISHAATNTAII